MVGGLASLVLRCNPQRDTRPLLPHPLAIPMLLDPPLGFREVEATTSQQLECTALPYLITPTRIVCSITTRAEKRKEEEQNIMLTTP